MINTKTDVINTALKQVKDGINYMRGDSYKMNMMDSFTPSFWQMNEIAVCFNLYNYGFSTDDWLGQEFEDADETRQDYADYYEDPDAIGFKPSAKDIQDAKKMVNYLDNNFDDNEILDTYNFNTPRPLTYCDIMKVYHSFKHVMLKAKPTKNMIDQYNHEIRNMSVINWN